MTDSAARRYHVFASGLDDDFFIDLEDALGELDYELGFDLRFVETLHPTKGQEIHVYRQEGDSITLTVTEDNELETRYLMTEGLRDTVEQIVDFLSHRLPIRSLAEWQQLAEQRLGTEPTLLIKVALASGEKADNKTLQLLQAGLSSPDRTVRLKAVEAASLTQWSALATPLARAFEQDVDPEVRNLAGQGLRLLLAANPQARNQ